MSDLTGTEGSSMPDKVRDDRPRIARPATAATQPDEDATRLSQDVSETIKRLIPFIGFELGVGVRDRERHRQIAAEVGEEWTQQDVRYGRLVPLLLPLTRWFMPVRVSDEVYRAHVNELFDRAVYSRWLQPGTPAEVLALLGTVADCDGLDEEHAPVLVWLCWEVLGQAFCSARGFPAQPAPSEGIANRCRDLSKRVGVAARVLATEDVLDG